MIFEEILHYLKAGNYVRRRSWPEAVTLSFPTEVALGYLDLIADDWEIVE